MTPLQGSFLLLVQVKKKGEGALLLLCRAGLTPCPGGKKVLSHQPNQYCGAVEMCSELVGACAVPLWGCGDVLGATRSLCSSSPASPLNGCGCVRMRLSLGHPFLLLIT